MPGASSRFPYIEATDARINFKEGAEKRPFSLTNAKFAMWQASSGEWQLRLKAQPVRTDLELQLSDAGVVTLDGSLRRAADVHAMPMKFQREWSGAQLGQVSRLLFGVDSGWRGDLDVTTSIEGNANDLALKTRVQISDLQRQEFQPASSVDVDARCTSRYQHPQKMLGEIQCFLPEGDGHLLLTGSYAGPGGTRSSGKGGRFDARDQSGSGAISGDDAGVDASARGECEGDGHDEREFSSGARASSDR